MNLNLPQKENQVSSNQMPLQEDNSNIQETKPKTNRMKA